MALLVTSPNRAVCFLQFGLICQIILYIPFVLLMFLYTIMFSCFAAVVLLPPSHPHSIHRMFKLSYLSHALRCLLTWSKPSWSPSLKCSERMSSACFVSYIRVESPSTKLTILKRLWPRVVSMRNHCKLDLLKLLAFDARTLRQSLLGILEDFTLFKRISAALLSSSFMCYHLLASSGR